VGATLHHGARFGARARTEVLGVWLLRSGVGQRSDACRELSQRIPKHAHIRPLNVRGYGSGGKLERFGHFKPFARDE
jgi:hypothetical protein